MRASWQHEILSPYNTFYPTKQTNFLLLCNKLGVPYEKEKQIWGETLTIVRFNIDANCLQIQICHESCQELAWTIQDFMWPGNWALNVYLLLRSGLLHLYNKMNGKSATHQSVTVSLALCYELFWFVDHHLHSDGIYMLDLLAWGPHQQILGLLWSTVKCSIAVYHCSKGYYLIYSAT